MAVASRGLSPPFVSLSVFLHNISKSDAARIASLDIEVFISNVSPGNLFILGVKRSKISATRHKERYRREVLHSCECWLFPITPVYDRR